MYAVIGAMDAEVEEFITKAEVKEEKEWAGFRFYAGRLADKDVVLAKSGVGKVLSAMFTQKLIELYKPEAIIFSGLAGALNPAYNVGDLVVSRDCMQHDLDATVFGFKRGEIPFSGYRVLKADPQLVRLTQGFRPEDGSLYVGRVLTGDQFITNAHSKPYGYLKKELAGDAIEMEGASVGLVATVNKVPFVLIRVISDKADGKAPMSFSKLTALASRKSFEIVCYILKRL